MERKKMNTLFGTHTTARLLCASLGITAVLGAMGCESKTQTDEPVVPASSEPDLGGVQADQGASGALADQKKSMDDPAAAAGMSRTSTIALEGGDVSVMVLQHGSFILQTDKLTIYVDPVKDALALDPSPQDRVPDIILLTDIHGDHLDVEAIKGLRKEGTVVVAPQAVVDKADGALSDALVMANGDSKSFEQPQALTLTATPMYNIKRTPEDSDTPFHVKGRGNGYVLELNSGKIYVSGDTECTPEMKALEAIDAAFITMNLPYTMPVEEAAECIRAFKPEAIYPFHYRGQDPSKLTALLAGVDGVEVRLLDWYSGAEQQ